MNRFTILAAAFTLALPLAAPGPAMAQEPVERDARTCACTPRADDEDRCVCWSWPDSVSTERMEAALERMEEALARARVEVDPERIREAMVRTEEALLDAHGRMGPQLQEAMGRMEHGLERARLEIERLRLDTLRVSRDLRPAIRLGLQFSPDPVEGVEGGVRLVGVTRRSGADEAGLRGGDVIVEVAGHDLQRPLPDERLSPDEGSPASQRLRALAQDLDEGDTVRIVYLRDGERRTARVEARRLDAWPTVIFRSMRPEAFQRGTLRLENDTILVWPPGAPRAPHIVPRVGPRETGRFGLRLMDLDADLGSYFGTEEGVVVLEVAEDAPVALRSGDVLLRIDGREVRDAEHARSIFRSYRQGEEVRIEVLRRGSTERIEGRAP